MHALRTVLGTLPLLLVGLQACISSEEVAGCYLSGRVPNAIPSTHNLFPYPTISQRLGEHGTTRLTVSIGPDGAPTNVAISQTSRSRRLDDAAATFIKANYRWQPPPEGCTPATAQATIVVNWRLDPLAGDDDVIMTDADYPPGAFDRAEEGNTLLEIVVGGGRIVSDVRISASSGSSDLDTKALAIMKSRIRDMRVRQGGSQYLNVLWRLPASAIAAQKRKGIEILEIHVPRIQLHSDCSPSARICF